MHLFLGMSLLCGMIKDEASVVQVKLLTFNDRYVVVEYTRRDGSLFTFYTKRELCFKPEKKR